MSEKEKARVHILRPDNTLPRTVPLEPWQLFWAKTEQLGVQRSCKERRACIFLGVRK